MTKRLLVTLLALCLGVSTLPGCTSGGAKDEADVAESNDQQFAEEGEGDFADTGDEAGGDEATGDEASNPDEATGDQASTEDAPVEDTGDDLSLGDEEQPKDDQALAEEPAANPDAAPEDDLSLDETGAEPAEKTDVAANDAPPVVEEPPPPTDEPVFDEPAKEEPTTEMASNEPPPAAEEPAAPVDTYSAPKAAPVYSPLLKIKDAAYTAADGTTLNRVYLARPKDNWKSVSTKLYGSPDRQKDLKKWNPGSVNTGKKIYYSSPSNPSDGRMLTHYEEQNIPPMTYTSQPGDNLRKVSKNLLGFNDAWKEVWSTNLNVESKGDIPAGTELKYWPESAAPTQTLAQTNMPPPTEPALPETAPQAPVDPMQPPPDIPPQPQASNLPPDQGMPGADPLAPPPPMPEDPTATGTTSAPPMNEPPPPPPPPVDEGPKPIKKAPIADASMDGGMDADTTMIIGLGGILLIAAAILFVVIRKNRAKRMDLGQTQV
ncbi:MAG: hypothetical protein V4760_12085 [Bdellovibrionota bacterium]